jgi:UDP:flavonoid glycosyltransferase YjiC (YdhE family)
MKIVLNSIGTRGDMEPFLAIGEILKEKGHHVLCAFPEQFRELAEEAGLDFASLGTSYLEMLESDLGKAAMGAGGSGLEKLSANIKLAGRQTEINKALVRRQYEIIERARPDRTLYNGKATYPIIWGLENRGKSILICPLPYMHYVRDHTHAVFNSNFGPAVNRLTYSLADFGVAATVLVSARWLGLRRVISRGQVRKALRSNKAIYTISPSLFPRPDYWPANLRVLGFHRRRPATTWQPGKDLKAFLAAHRGARILFVTFGSMINPDPEAKTRVILDILERNQIPAIINTASGGLIEPGSYDADRIHFVGHIPYDWIFPRVHGVIHHGGSGTTHMALRYGCSVMVIPHILDQIIWDKIVYEQGVGPRGIRIHRLTVEALEPKILELVRNSAFKQKAGQLAGRMEREKFREEIYQSIIQE